MTETTREVLSTGNFEDILKWIEDGSLDKPAVADCFMTTLNYLFTERKAAPRTPARLSMQSLFGDAELTQPIQENSEHESKMDKLESWEPAKTGKPFGEEGRDSLDIAKAIAWHYSRLESEITHGHAISMSLLQLSLLTIYGTVLAERETRLVKEHPQMWKFGPVFPRVYGKMKKPSLPESREADAIREQDPQLDELIRRTVTQYALRNITHVISEHRSKTSPWGKCHKANGDKWDSVISDREIAAWFKKKIDQSKPITPTGTHS